MPRPRRGQQVPPPPASGEWDLRYATKESLQFREMERMFPGNCAEAKRRPKTMPGVRSAVQKPLRGTLGKRTVGGTEMSQWQYDISSSARLWYCIDPSSHTVWLTLASMGHPHATDAKGTRTPTSR